MDVCTCSCFKYGKWRVGLIYVTIDIIETRTIIVLVTQSFHTLTLRGQLHRYKLLRTWYQHNTLTLRRQVPQIKKKCSELGTN